MAVVPVRMGRIVVLPCDLQVPGSMPGPLAMTAEIMMLPHLEYAALRFETFADITLVVLAVSPSLAPPGGHH